MPAPFTIVTFADADGDEFPVRVGFVRPGYTRVECVRLARVELQRLVVAGDMRPTEPTHVVKVETV